MPDACLMFFDQVLAFDHVKKEILLIVTANLNRDKAPGAPFMRSHRMGGSARHAEAYAHAVKRLDRLEKRLARALPKPSKKHAHGALKLSARTPKAAFLKSVLKTKEYIASGDVFQCVLSQRFDCVPGVDAFEVYRALRIVNPSPYMYFLRFQGTGNSKQGTGKQSQTVDYSVPYCGLVAGAAGAGAWADGGVQADCGDAAAQRRRGGRPQRWRPTCGPMRKRSPSM